MIIIIIPICSWMFLETRACSRMHPRQAQRLATLWPIFLQASFDASRVERDEPRGAAIRQATAAADVGRSKAGARAPVREA